MKLFTRREALLAGTAGAAMLASTASHNAVAQTVGGDLLRTGKPLAGKTVSFISLNYTYSAGLKALAPEFEKATGIKVNFDLLGTLDNIQKQRLELSAGSGGLDVYQIPPFNRAEYHRAGWLEPLNSYMDNPALTPAAWDKSDFFPVSLEQGMSKGQQFDLPIFAATIVLYWRKDVFEKAGLSGPPKTLDEMLAAAKIIKEKVPDIAPVGLRGAPGIEANMWPFPIFLYSYGGNFFKDFPTDMHPVIDDKGSIEAVTVWSTLVKDYGFPGMVNATHEELIVNMQQGRVAMVLDGHPLAGVFLNKEKSKSYGKTGVAPIPSGPAGLFPAFSEHGIAIAKNSGNKEAAWEFVKWATSKDVQLRIAIDGNYVAATRRSVVSDPAYRAKYNFADGELLDATQQMLERRKPTYIPAIPEWSELADVIGNQVSRATLGGSSPAEAMKAAAKGMDVILRRAGYY
ncbi:MAG: sugar ABC transporter substrate-binding protein [Variovorax sp.]